MKILRPLLVFLVLISAQRTFSQDQQPVYVGIRSEDFKFYASPQHNSNWCWAASLQMIFNYYGVNITQEQIVARSYGIDPNGELPNWTGSWQVITANLNNWSVDNSGRQYAVRAVFYQGAPNPAYLIQELSRQHPILIGYQSGPNSGHAVVITACSYTESYYGPVIQSIVVRDPWPSEENAATEGRREYTGISLANLIQGHWYIMVQ
ncbi:C39 family peptidase [Mucilaginibacter ginsenosidivorans]|uniref:Peptidase C39-like domain-containing protein n=1 Tax=Mucilaginibacter ginsenosidivorans TaxID=398053 RepID=A0A5B8UV61_9SPHI|nr:C39 family peptidase [Mucilaginibacter ginsenosidivorans]QEC62823.1 hypothetical protein FRZ54_09620 [Mucilaginibacter ginsenosidivorans]